MLYTIKEYDCIFTTPAKKEQEKAVISKIMSLLNRNKYNNLEDFADKNGSYQDFLKRNNFETVVKHFGNTLTEQDFSLLINKMRELTRKKKTFENENIKTSRIDDDNEYVSFKGNERTIFLDNSSSNKTIEEQMRAIQPTGESFQTADIFKNTENMFKSLEATQKESLNFKYLIDIDYQKLSDEQKEFYKLALQVQESTKSRIRIDLDRGLLVDEKNVITKINKEDGNYVLDSEEKQDEKESVNVNELGAVQKTLTYTNPNTIYSQNNA